MIRALHLIDADADYELSSTHQQLARALGEGYSIHTERVQENIASFMTTTLELRRKPDERFDVIHAFGSTSLAVALFFGGKVVYTVSVPPRKRMIGWLRAAMNYRDLHVVCPTEVTREWIVRNGVPIERCHLIRPGVDFSRVKPKKDFELRKKFGFTQEDYVVLPGGETSHRAFHLYAVQATTILHWLDHRYKSLLWGRGPLTHSREIRREAQAQRISLRRPALPGSRRRFRGDPARRRPGAFCLALSGADPADRAGDGIGRSDRLGGPAADVRDPRRPTQRLSRRHCPSAPGRQANSRDARSPGSDLENHRHGPHRSIRVFLADPNDSTLSNDLWTTDAGRKSCSA